MIVNINFFYMVEICTLNHVLYLSRRSTEIVELPRYLKTNVTIERNRTCIVLQHFQQVFLNARRFQIGY